MKNGIANSGKLFMPFSILCNNSTGGKPSSRIYPNEDKPSATAIGTRMIIRVNRAKNRIRMVIFYL